MQALLSLMIFSKEYCLLLGINVLQIVAHQISYV